MKTHGAPGITWAVRLRWGSRRLAAELLGGQRRRLTAGSEPEDDLVTSGQGRVELDVDAGGSLRVAFSLGVTGHLQLGDGAARLLGECIERGEVREEAGYFVVRLAPDHRARLRLGSLTMDLRRAGGRLQRLPYDARVLGLVLLALVGIAVLVWSVAAPVESPAVRWAPKSPGR